jgi:hypothetical protein
LADVALRFVKVIATISPNVSLRIAPASARRPEKLTFLDRRRVLLLRAHGLAKCCPR